MMLIGGVLFMPLALCYAWMATRFDHSGGSVLYGEAAFGRFVGFQAGWARYTSAIVTAAANTHVIIAYLAALFPGLGGRSEEHTSELQSLMRISYAVFCLKKKK